MITCVVSLSVLLHAVAGVKAKGNPPAKEEKKTPPGQAKRATRLSIDRDASGQIILSWKGKGVLKKATRDSDGFQTIYDGNREYVVVEPTEDEAWFQLEDEQPQPGASNVYSLNVVGYVNVRLHPGLSLISVPLRATNMSVQYLLQYHGTNLTDGSQVFKYDGGITYEVNTYDGISGQWSNPDMDLSVGTGFFFRNLASVTITQTFVGEVLQGTLVNPIPAGTSTKGSMVPQKGALNDIHQVPGEPGDEIRTYVNDQQGGGTYNVSVYTAEGVWYPALVIDVAEGFWIQKQNAQDWVRNFTVP